MLGDRVELRRARSQLLHHELRRAILLQAECLADPVDVARCQPFGLVDAPEARAISIEVMPRTSEAAVAGEPVDHELRQQRLRYAPVRNVVDGNAYRRHRKSVL